MKPLIISNSQTQSTLCLSSKVYPSGEVDIVQLSAGNEPKLIATYSSGRWDSPDWERKKIFDTALRVAGREIREYLMKRA